MDQTVLLLRCDGDMLINAPFAQHMAISFLERMTTQLEEKEGGKLNLRF
jgi:hypothetical protein